MTLIRYRRRGSPVRISDWTASAHCPDCEKLLATFRLSPEREGFYMVSKELPHDPPEHVAIVQTFALAKATTVCAAEYAALVCPTCWSRVVQTPAAGASARAARRGLSPFKQVGRDQESASV